MGIIGAFKDGLRGTEYICETCGSVGEPKTFTKGSFLIELFIWGVAFVATIANFVGALLFLPALAYTVWRFTSKFKGCRVCRGKTFPSSTPRGQELLRHYHSAPQASK